MDRRSEDRESLLRRLAAMPDFLTATFSDLSPAEARIPGPQGAFSPVEHCWHLADLEWEGYATRIRRLSSEDDPMLPDFDGARLAEERQYRDRSLPEGLRAFREARSMNIEVLRSIDGSGWTRAGAQEGVGRISLGDVPAMMALHDEGHRQEIEEWLQARKE